VVAPDFSRETYLAARNVPWAQLETAETVNVEQLAGYLVASLSRRGCVDELPDEENLIFENALAVFYHRAHIDLVREQIEAEFGAGAHYDVLEEGLVVHPFQGDTELVFDLDTRIRKKLKPRIYGQKPQEPQWIWSENVLYRQQRISFEDWEDAWRSAEQSEEILLRLTAKASLVGEVESARSSTARG